MSVFLGVDGGGSKTEFLLIDAEGAVLATARAGPAYHPEIGLDGLEQMMRAGAAQVLASAGVQAGQVQFAFFGVPAYGEDPSVQARLDAIGAPLFAPGRYRVGNDMVCGWAGALAGADGINVVAGTGSIVYGEYQDRSARVGGWGEIFGDEGSAYWFAREGLGLFSRMSDGRLPRGPLHGLLREHLGLHQDLDLCAHVNSDGTAWRSKVALLARVVAQAAALGDAAVQELFERGAQELAAMVFAARRHLAVPEGVQLVVSYSGGMFRESDLLLTPLRRTLEQSGQHCELRAPRLPPHAGAALQAARCAGTPLADAAVRNLERLFA